MTWRIGRKLGRTIYRQLGDQPSDHDELIGVMDDPSDAELAVTAVNEHLRAMHVPPATEPAVPRPLLYEHGWRAYRVEFVNPVTNERKSYIVVELKDQLFYSGVNRARYVAWCYGDEVGSWQVDKHNCSESGTAYAEAGIERPDFRTYHAPVRDAVALRAIPTR